MRKAVSIITVTLIIFTLASCKNNDNKPESSKKTSSKTVSSEESVIDPESETTVTSAEVSSGAPVPSKESISSRAVSKASSVSSKASSVSSTASADKNIDKAWVEEPGALSGSLPVGFKSDYNAAAKTMRTSIITAKDTVKVTGTTFYVSPKGNNSNSGKSPEEAWQTLAAVNGRALQIKAGDAVLFERGQIFRNAASLKLSNGVYYGAYGTGDKPCIYGSAQNYANAQWKNQGGNIWLLDTALGTDVGIIVFNHGEQSGWKRSSKTELTANYDFFSDKSNGHRVYLYLNKNPTEAFKSIEIGADNRLLLMDSGARDITIENLTIKYTGSHAIRGSNCSNITVRNCEIGFVGGSLLASYGDGTTRYGNAVEFMSESKNVLVENCWIYQIYDSGVTHQGSGSYHLKGFTVKNCLIEYCGMGSIEYWHTSDNDIADVLYTGNLMRFAGYCFGGRQRPDKHLTAHIQSNGKPTGAGYNKSANFVISNNIFELSSYQIINATSSAGTPPTLSGNTYIQTKGLWLGYYQTNSNKKFNDDVLTLLKDTWNDKTAKISFK